MMWRLLNWQLSGNDTIIVRYSDFSASTGLAMAVLMV